jgi:hypothetical protein
MKMLLSVAAIALLAVPAAAQQLVLGSGAFAESGSIASGGSQSGSTASVIGLTFGTASGESGSFNQSGAAAGGGAVLTFSESGQFNTTTSAAGALGAATSLATGINTSAGAGGASGFSGFGFTAP